MSMVTVQSVERHFGGIPDDAPCSFIFDPRSWEPDFIQEITPKAQKITTFGQFKKEFPEDYHAYEWSLTTQGTISHHDLELVMFNSGCEDFIAGKNSCRVPTELPKDWTPENPYFYMYLDMMPWLASLLPEELQRRVDKYFSEMYGTTRNAEFAEKKKKELLQNIENHRQEALTKKKL